MDGKELKMLALNQVLDYLDKDDTDRVLARLMSRTIPEDIIKMLLLKYYMPDLARSLPRVRFIILAPDPTFDEPHMMISNVRMERYQDLIKDQVLNICYSEDIENCYRFGMTSEARTNRLLHKLIEEIYRDYPVFSYDIYEGPNLEFSDIMENVNMENGSMETIREGCRGYYTLIKSCRPPGD